MFPILPTPPPKKKITAYEANMVEPDSPKMTMIVKWKLISALEGLPLPPPPKYRQDVFLEWETFFSVGVQSQRSSNGGLTQ